MNKFVALLTKEKWLRKNGKMMTLNFFKLYTVYIKKLRQFFSHICFDKDTSALLKSYKYLSKLIS